MPCTVSEAAIDAYISEHLRQRWIIERNPRQAVRMCLEAAVGADAQLLRDVIAEVEGVYESEPAVRGAMRYLKHRLALAARTPGGAPPPGAPA